MNAAFCCASHGIVPAMRHAGYLGSWLDVLKERQPRHHPRGVAGEQGGRLHRRIPARR
jgi:antirestriction protein ArdC